MMELVRTLYAKRPDWIEGYISFNDALFLSEMLQKHPQGSPIVEIGVASGCSSALLLQMLSCSPPSGGVWLHSYDISRTCYFDRNRATGEAVAEMVPTFEKHWQFHLGSAQDLGASFAPASVHFAFVDGAHSHPWPTLDFFAILPYLASNAWVALHDINLPAITDNPKWKMHGPKYIYDAWPWDKRISNREHKNIGAVCVPGNHSEVIAFLKTCMECKWESRIPEELLLQVGFSEDPLLQEKAAII